ncbi:ABC transporter ATP-binding protein [Isoptericola halotolerans]|uniref:ABC transporter ATP-binding protein n=1 Tax=Isoptericola halotolerans TaxID=300560 RepID=UPI00388D8978
MISAEHVSHAYTDAEVLHRVSVTADLGEVVGLIGPNGSGKTTLLRALYGALAPTRGGVTVDGTEIRHLRARDVAREIAVVVQEPPGELPLSVIDTVLLGRSPHLRAWQRQTELDIDVAGDALRRVGAEHLAGRDVADLSGGEKQRVLIARALAQRATHLLMDEPTNHLDIHFQHEVLALVRELGVTTIIVLHDLNLAARYCDRLVLLDRGHVVASGTVEEVLRPDVLEPVYGIRIQRVEADDGRPQLLFRAPEHRHPASHRHTSGTAPDAAALAAAGRTAASAPLADDD